MMSQICGRWAITIEVAAGTFNGALTVGTRVKHKRMLSDEQRLKLVMKLPHILDGLIRELSVGLPVPRPEWMAPGSDTTN